MIIEIPKNDSFDVPEGTHPAVCIEVRECKKDSSSLLRLLWELQLEAETTRYLAGKNYKPSLAAGSELRKDLESWLGALPQTRRFDPAILKGRKANLTIVHIHSNPHPKPFCWVSKVEPGVN